MTQTKFFEVRDSATFIPVLAIKLEPVNSREQFLFSRAGFGPSQYIGIVDMNGGCNQWSCDEYDFTKNRTMHHAHIYIQKNWDTLRSGDLIDVQFILGETKQPKISEEFY